MPVFDKDNILKFFRGLYLTKAKDSISSYLIKKGVSILEINAYLDELSEHLKERIMPTLDEYGIKLLNFYVIDINVSEDDHAVKKLKDALSKKAEMNIVEYNYVQECSFNTLNVTPGQVTQGGLWLENETVSCPGCGASNTKRKGKPYNCDYCGVLIK